MKVSIIVARAKNGVIGRSNQLPWYLPADLKHFKELTLHKSVIMGRNTYESIVKKLGHPLPERQNIVLTKEPSFKASGVYVAKSINQALSLAKYPVFIIGGAQVYQQALPIADTLYITEVQESVPGDAYFPVLAEKDWSLVSQEDHSSDEKNQFAYSFAVFKRKS